MLVFWGNGSQQAKDLVSQISVRSTDNFNWTFIFILAVVWPCMAFIGCMKSETRLSVTFLATLFGRSVMNQRPLFS